MKTSARNSSIPFGLFAIYALGVVLIALNLKNYLLD